MENIKFFCEIDLFDFTSVFGPDFLNFSGSRSELKSEKCNWKKSNCLCFKNQLILMLFEWSCPKKGMTNDEKNSKTLISAFEKISNNVTFQSMY